MNAELRTVKIVNGIASRAARIRRPWHAGHTLAAQKVAGHNIPSEARACPGGVRDPARTFCPTTDTRESLRDLIEQIDWTVGQMLKTIRKRGIAEHRAKLKPGKDPLELKEGALRWATEKKGTGLICAKPGTDRRLVAGLSGK